MFSQETRILMGQMTKRFGTPLTKKTQSRSIWNREPKLEVLGRDVYQRMVFGQLDVLKDYSRLGDFMFGETFRASKKAILAQVKKTEFNSHALLMIKRAKSPKELYIALFNYQKKLFNNYIKTIDERYISELPKGKITLEYEQAVREVAESRYEAILNLQKTLIKNSSNPAVVQVEKILKTRFGVTAKLNDDIEKAGNILLAVSNAHKNKMPLPNKILISDLPVTEGEAMKFKGENIVVLGSTRFSNDRKYAAMIASVNSAFGKFSKKFSKAENAASDAFENKIGTFSSTENPIHIEQHELAHFEHPYLQSFSNKRIPMRFKFAAENLSGYARASSNCMEIRTELSTKQTLDNRLTSDEAELFKFLGGEIRATTKIDDYSTFRDSLIREFLRLIENR